MVFEDFEYEIKYGLVRIISYNGSGEKVEIPEKIDNHSVYTICSHAFLDVDNLKEVIIPSSVGRIEESAFIDCLNLEKVKLHSVEEFSKDSFKDCHERIRFVTKDVITLKKVSEACKNYGVVCEDDFKIKITDEENKECILLDVKNREKIFYIPDEIDGYKVIGMDFTLREPDNSGDYRNIKLPKYLKKIPDEFFYGVWIDELELPDSVEEIGKKAFCYCQMNRVINKGTLKLPKALKRIGDYAFESCEWLSRLIIPDGVEYIGKQAFNYCTKLVSIDISDSVRYIGEGTFSYCTGLQDVRLPKSMETIESELFWKCENLSKIKVPENVVKIGVDAFYGCHGLVDVSLPDGLIEIEQNAFQACSSLGDITIPNTVTVIGMKAFDSCDNLEVIYYSGIAYGETWGARYAHCKPNRTKKK